jgi:hypothetical protein
MRPGSASVADTESPYHDSRAGRRAVPCSVAASAA